MHLQRYHPAWLTVGMSEDQGGKIVEMVLKMA